MDTNIKLFENRKVRSVWDTEGNEPVTNCNGLKMLAADGKSRTVQLSESGFARF
jgi:hypothetical protein